MFGEHRDITVELKRVLNHEEEILTRNQRDSILQKISSSLYRIQDKELREVTQTRIFRYLGGDLKKPPMTGIAVLDNTLRSDLAVRLRLCCIETKTRPSSQTCVEFRVDRFEVGYIIRKITADPKIIANVEFGED